MSDAAQYSNGHPRGPRICGAVGEVVTAARRMAGLGPETRAGQPLAAEISGNAGDDV